MDFETRTIKEARTLMLQALRAAAPFFLSIEVLLMFVVAFASVAGVWLAVLGDALCLLPLGFSVAYLVARPVLHMKRILAWPFMA